MNRLQPLRALTATLLGAALCAGALAQTAPAADSLAVVRDATTGELRAPNAEEAQALSGATARSATTERAAQPTLRRHAGGAASVRMTDASLTHAVGVRKANGHVQAQCFDSKDSAKAAVSMSSVAVATHSQAATK